MVKINLISHNDAKSPISEVYRIIRTNLAFAGAGKKIRTICVSSAIANEGKSTTIANLAVVLAQNGFKVCLVDCDLRNPSDHMFFGVQHNKGVSNYIANGFSVDDYIIHTDVDGLDFISSGPIPPNPSELLASEAMDKLLKTLAENYDYVLVDTPPVLPVTDAAVLSNKVDGSILVIESGAISPDVALEAKRRLEQGGANILGVVLNKVDISTGSYGYKHYYYYGHK